MMLLFSRRRGNTLFFVSLSLYNVSRDFLFRTILLKQRAMCMDDCVRNIMVDDAGENVSV